MKQQKRLLAWILCIGMVLVLFSCSVCIAREADHHCAGDACEICRIIALAESVMQSFRLLGFILLAWFSLLALVQSIHWEQNTFSDIVSTLVSWKVRLNN